MSAPSRPDHPERISSRLPPNVWVLGAVAFFNDTATEMSYWLLPQFLVGVLGAGPLVFGLIEGAAETIASVGRLLSGVISDRLRRRKPLAALGYTPYGLYYAMTEGVLKAWVADVVPSRSLASVYGLFNWIVGVAAFPASLLAGWL